MPKIKNWSRIKHRERKKKAPMFVETEFFWKNDKSPTVVRVLSRRKETRNSNTPKYVAQWLESDSTQAAPNTIAEYDNKDRARKIAVRWMRRHPRG